MWQHHGWQNVSLSSETEYYAFNGISNLETQFVFLRFSVKIRLRCKVYVINPGWQDFMHQHKRVLRSSKWRRSLFIPSQCQEQIIPQTLRDRVANKTSPRVGHENRAGRYRVCWSFGIERPFAFLTFYIVHSQLYVVGSSKASRPEAGQQSVGDAHSNPLSQSSTHV